MFLRSKYSFVHLSCLFVALLGSANLQAQVAADAEAPVAAEPAASPDVAEAPAGPPPVVDAPAADAPVAKEPVVEKEAAQKVGTEQRTAGLGESSENTHKAQKDASAADDAGLVFTLGKATIDLGVRVIGGWEYQVDELTAAEQAANLRETEFGWFLSQARFTVDASWDKEVSLQLDLDFSDDEDPLRDAWLNYRFERELQLRVGQFKRAFSRLELRGAGKIPLRSRGLANEHIVGDLGYGERGVGAELWGKVRSLGLEWHVGASNPPPRRPGVDLHARLTQAPSAWLELGAGVVHKITENNATATPDFIGGNAAGVDLKIDHGPLYVLVDALIGENLGTLGLLEPDPRAVREHAGSVGGYGTYRIDLPSDWELEPMLFGEWVDTNLEFSRSEVVRAVVGVNALWHEDKFRVMPQLELIRPLHGDSEALWTQRDTFYLLLSGEI